MSERTVYGFVGKQRDRNVITGVLKAEDLIAIHEIDVWKPGKPIEEQGCQRQPIQSHFRKIGRKLKEDERMWLPTSITLSANNGDGDASKKHSVKIEIVESEIPDLVKIIIPKGHTLRVVDGQHRIKGLEYAIRDLKQDEIADFKLPFVLTLTDDRVDEIKTFYDINSTPKRVATDLALQLLNDMNTNEAVRLSKTEKWKLVALNVAMQLNKNPESVWYQNISIGQSKSGEIASSTSFVASMRPILEISFIKRIWEQKSEDEAGKRIADFVDAYWSALKQVMPKAFPEAAEEKSKWVIQKTPGIFAWHMVAPLIIDEFMIKREGIKSITPEVIADFVNDYGLMATSTYEEFWKGSNKVEGNVGGYASRANSQKAFKELAEEIKDDISYNYEETNATDIEF